MLRVLRGPGRGEGVPASLRRQHPRAGPRCGRAPPRSARLRSTRPHHDRQRRRARRPEQRERAARRRRCGASGRARARPIGADRGIGGGDRARRTRARDRRGGRRRTAVPATPAGGRPLRRRGPRAPAGADPARPREVPDAVARHAGGDGGRDVRPDPQPVLAAVRGDGPRHDDRRLERQPPHPQAAARRRVGEVRGRLQPTVRGPRGEAAPGAAGAPSGDAVRCGRDVGRAPARRPALVEATGALELRSAPPRPRLGTVADRRERRGRRRARAAGVLGAGPRARGSLPHRRKASRSRSTPRRRARSGSPAIGPRRRTWPGRSSCSWPACTRPPSW